MLPPLFRQTFQRTLKAPAFKAQFLLCLVVFTAAMASSFSKRVFGMALAFDSAMYLNTASTVLACLQSLCAFRLPDPHTYGLLVDGMLLDGPILPLVGGLFFAAVGLKPQIQNIEAALVLQAILQALSALLVYKVTYDVSRKRTAALLGGFAWGLYPAALLGAGKFMTETLACCLVMALVLNVGRLGKKTNAFAAGAIVCMIALTKAALTPACALAILFGFCALIKSGQSKSTLVKTFLATVFGAAIIIAPWLMFTHRNVGQPLLTANRQPTHNIISGLNPENDGWASLPDTPLGSMFSENDPPLPSAVGVAMPVANFEIQLMARKVVRLFSQPWNDYRLHCLGLPEIVQIFWHRAIVALAVLGAIGLIIKQRADSGGTYAPARSELMFCLLLIILCGHLIYLPFVACSRYGFTAVPVFVVLATAGTAALFAMGKKVFAAAATLFATAFMFQLNMVKIIPDNMLNESGLDILAATTAIKLLVCLFAINYMVRLLQEQNGVVKTSWAHNAFLSLITTGLMCATAADTYYEPLNTEHTFKITKDNPLMRVCRLDQEELNNPNLKAAYLIIDSQLKKTVSGTVDVNGHFLPLMISPLCWLNPEDNLSACYEMFAKLRHQNSSDLRQWYAVELPKHTLKPGLNSIVVAPSGQTHLEVNGSVKARPLQGQYVNLPSLTLFSPTILGNDLGGIDARPRERVYIASGEGERNNAGAEANPANAAKSNANVLVLLVYDQGDTKFDRSRPVDLSDCLIVPH